MHSSERICPTMKRQPIVTTKPELTTRYSKSPNWAEEYTTGEHDEKRRTEEEPFSEDASDADYNGYEAEVSDIESVDDEAFYSDEVQDVLNSQVEDKFSHFPTWLFCPQELQVKLERVKSERDKLVHDVSVTEQYTHYLSGEHYIMGDGKGIRLEQNKLTSHHVKSDDQMLADTKMASVATPHTQVEETTATDFTLTRDNIRLSYRLSKANLHPHFNSLADSVRGKVHGSKLRSASNILKENAEFGIDDGFENAPENVKSCRRFSRRSMTLASIEDALDVNSRTISETHKEMQFCADSKKADFFPPTSVPAESIELTFPKVEFENVAPEAQNCRPKWKVEHVALSDMPISSKNHHRYRGSISPESTTPGTPLLLRRAFSENKNDSKLKPKELMAKLKQNFSRKSKYKEKKSTPVASVPISRVDSGTFIQTYEQTVRLRNKAVNRDPSARLTWHGSTTTETATDNAQVQHIRSRKVGVSPVENARYSAELHTYSSTLNVAEFDRQVKSVVDFYEEDSDNNSSSALASSASSLCSSNTSSRPVSATDLQWEKYNVTSNIRRIESEGSVQRCEHGMKRHGSSCSVNNIMTRTTNIGSQTKHNRSISSPGSPLLKRHSNLETIQRNDDIDMPICPDAQSVSFGEDEQRRLNKTAKTPKPKHQPRRVKTDLGDNRSVFTALYQCETMDVNGTPTPLRRQYQRRAIFELGESSEIKEAIYKIEKKPVREKNDQTNSIMTTEGHVPGQKEEHSKPVDFIKLSHKDTKAITRTYSLRLGSERKRSDSTETVKRTPSVPSLLGIDSVDINEEDWKAMDLTQDKELYLPDNVELLAYGLETVEILAEAVWDHITMDETELAFQAGDVIEVTDTTDKNWWWGYLGDNEGWIPTQFIRLRVSQGETVEECMERLHQEKTNVSEATHGRISRSFLSNDQVRTNVVHEILTTERDYVKQLRDVCEGYLEQARQRPEMFSKERIRVIFGNIEEIYSFHKNFSLMLETSIHPEWPHLSEIGKSFLNHKNGFDIYSDYCNNYPRAIGELQVLMQKPRYQHFFEACRLLQNMIEISLNGFLLTPVQKICKYPLQLGELLKYTRAQHHDYQPLQEALHVMKDVAVRINERKRTIETIEKIAAWRKSILDWEGEDILVRSSRLIHSGEVTKILVKSGRKRTTDRSIYLFDHQLIICKKDMLRRGYQYRKRLNNDRCRVNDLPDGRENAWNINIKNGWKVWDTETYKMYIFCVKTVSEKVSWLQAFADERAIVEEDRSKGVHIPNSTKEAVMNRVTPFDPPSKPSGLTVSRKISGMPFDYQHKIMNEQQTKVTLPDGISSTNVFKERRRRGRFNFNRKQSDEV